MIYPWIEATGCCTLVLENLHSTVSHWEQVGIARKANFPEEANLLIVGGWLNESQQEKLKNIFERMPKNKLVLAVGTCSLSGSVFEDVPGLKKLSDFLPVHYQVTGCPPRWDDVLKGITRVTNSGEKEKSVKEILNDTGSDIVF